MPATRLFQAQLQHPQALPAERVQEYTGTEEQQVNFP